MYDRRLTKYSVALGTPRLNKTKPPRAQIRFKITCQNRAQSAQQGISILHCALFFYFVTADWEPGLSCA